MLWSSGSLSDMQQHSVRERYYEGYLTLLNSSPGGILQDSLPVVFVVQRIIFAWRMSKRQSPIVQKFIMEFLKIKVSLHSLLGLGSKFSYLQLTHFVGECLSRPGDIPVYL